MKICFCGRWMENQRRAKVEAGGSTACRSRFAKKGSIHALRAKLLRKEQDSFGPFFAERIINRIKSLKKEIDYQIFSFSGNTSWQRIGIVVALVVLNIVLSDQLTVKSVLGFEMNRRGYGNH